MLEGCHFRDFLHMLSHRNCSIIISEGEFSCRPCSCTQVLGRELFEAQILGSGVVGFNTAFGGDAACETHASQVVVGQRREALQANDLPGRQPHACAGGDRAA